VGKTRNPVGVWLLTFVTLGIYGLYWWYKINDEVGEFDESIDVNPVLSLLAMFVPIANIVSLVRTGGRIGQAQENTLGRKDCSGLIGFLLAFVLGLYIVYYQANLNRLWASQGAPAEY
jgi:hypothetical protein